MEIVNYICTHSLTTGNSRISSLSWTKGFQVTCRCTALWGGCQKARYFLASLSFWMRWNCSCKRRTRTIPSSLTPSGLWIWPFWSTCCVTWTDWTWPCRVSYICCLTWCKCVCICQQTEAVQDAYSKGRFSAFSRSAKIQRARHLLRRPERAKSQICNAGWKPARELCDPVLWSTTEKATDYVPRRPVQCGDRLFESPTSHGWGCGRVGDDRSLWGGPT